MRIRSLKLHQFMSHEQTTLDFPPSGVVLVTGDNRAGKSSIIEAVATTVWGKTLRTTKPWREDHDGMTQVVADGIAIERTYSTEKGTKLYWGLNDDGTETGAVYDSMKRLGGTEESGTDNPRFESKTQAQNALDRLVGPYDVWRRSSTFSSADAAHFSLATDSERKRLLETILGLDIFDSALEECRADLRKTERAATDAAAASYRATTDLNAARGRLGDAERAFELAEAEIPPELPRASEDVLAKLRGHIESLTKGVGLARGALRIVEGNAYVALSELRKAEDNERRSKRDTSTCPTCGQKLPGEAKKHVAADLDALRKKADAAKADADEKEKAVGAETAELEELLRGVNSRLSAKLGENRAADERDVYRRRAEAAKARAAGDLETARETLRGATKRAAEAEAKEAALTVEKETLETVEVVLGLKGVRVGVLAKSLDGLGAVANAWLGRLGIPELSLTLKPYSEKKTGGVTDSIGVVLAGAGGGHGYKAGSGGERRRVDLALLLGLSEVATAATGSAPGTLFFDELFDALDGDGVKAVSVALEDLAKDRCVVVISHNPELVRELPATKRWNVSGGKVTVEG
jgi:DNA repair exonuclease SbcCD ATPase subunit